MTGWIANPLPIALSGQLLPTPCLQSTHTVSLSQNSVHVWFTSLQPEKTQIDFFTQQLDRTELGRMARFAFQPLRDRYACAHGLLRLLLCSYLGCSPSEVLFHHDSHGKPLLIDAQGLTFSLSHSGDGVAIAVGRDVELGIDIELIKPIEERDQLVERFFSAQEAACYQSLPYSLREDAFFKLWTRKEAFVKALGLGLSYPLESFSVGIDSPVTLKAACANPWTLRHLAPGLGHVGAIAVSSDNFALSGGYLTL